MLSLILLAEVFRSHTTENKELPFENRLSTKSLIYIKTKSGPLIEPGGIPAYFLLDF